MRFAFHKMHGLGNDFVVIDARSAPVVIDAGVARGICDRRQGIGCDQLILIEAADGADAAMRIWNPDGSEAGACGNASRCVAMLLGDGAAIDTPGGRITARVAGDLIEIDMGLPRFHWEAVPLAYPLDTLDVPVGWGDLGHGTALSVGNPHIVFFVAEDAEVDLATLGPLIEHDALFPERINVGVARVTGSSAIRLDVWERGAGLTRACGTGACAAAVAAVRRRLVNGPVTVTLPGGDLEIDWTPGTSIRMRGPATHVFTGEADLGAFA
ncbi:diaminopimelate epimerase [Sphingomonas jejuensis]|uniref:Diaminopimelate epimerase n=1 Tax=Sphingomonas jejuensis TaxID=904715 RepID=A0ABX0XJ44_9SPHN|nr:diaminopimelate epimerase [Sphingomonas jejuensis]NJC33363.1 diaminopimelate epimerase [Sphingomonas jejuensis]